MRASPFLAAAALLALSCGQGSGTTAMASSSPSSVPFASPCVGLTSPIPVPPASTWPAFTDPKYGFTVSHPPGFPFFKPSNFPSFDPVLVRYDVANRCPMENPGASWGVEVFIYTKDADTLTTWVQRHTDNRSCGVGQVTGFLFNVINVKPMTAGGRDAVSFDEVLATCGEGGTAAHLTAFFLGSSHVFLLRWYSDSDHYAPTVQLIAQEMLASVKG